MSSLLYSQLYVIIIYLDCVTNDTMEHLMDRKILVQAIKQQKESLDVSYETISSISRVSTSTVKRAAKGLHVEFDNLERIAEALGIDIEVKIKRSSRQTLYKKRVDALAKSMVAKVIKTSSLELQEPDEHTRKAIYAKFVKKIKAMPEEKVWRTRL